MLARQAGQGILHFAHGQEGRLVVRIGILRKQKPLQPVATVLGVAVAGEIEEETGARAGMANLRREDVEQQRSQLGSRGLLIDPRDHLVAIVGIATVILQQRGQALGVRPCRGEGADVLVGVDPDDNGQVVLELGRQGRSGESVDEHRARGALRIAWW